MHDAPWQRLLATVVAALADLTCVRVVASFGSVAERRADALSDLDLFVGCADVERTAWLAAAAIRATKPVLYYRMFTGVPQPSGRYWFEDEHPFTRLDVSFYDEAGFATVCRDGLKEALPITARTEYVAKRPADPRADALVRDPAPRIPLSGDETAAGRDLYVHLETLKGVRRGSRPAVEADASRRALEAALATDGLPVGFQRLARRALDL